MGDVTERPWCVAHDRSAEFTADFPTQRTVCWSGLCNPAAQCRLVVVTVTRKDVS